MAICITGGRAFEVKVCYASGMVVWCSYTKTLHSVVCASQGALFELCTSYLDIVALKDSSSDQVVAFASIFAVKSMIFKKKRSTLTPKEFKAVETHGFSCEASVCTQG